MLRKLLAAGAVLVVGYLAGLLFGYRAAVVDYVENDAETIQSMADTMYQTADFDELPEEVQEAIERAQGRDDDGDNGTGERGFQ